MLQIFSIHFQAQYLNWSCSIVLRFACDGLLIPVPLFVVEVVAGRECGHEVVLGGRPYIPSSSFGVLNFIPIKRASTVQFP